MKKRQEILISFPVLVLIGTLLISLLAAAIFIEQKKARSIKYYGVKVVSLSETEPDDLSCVYQQKTLYEFTEGPAEGSRQIVCGYYGEPGDEFKVRLPL